DFALEVAPVPHLHELVGVPRVAVFAAKFAAAVGIDGPGKRQAAARLAVERRTGLEREVLDLGALADLRARGRHARDAHEPLGTTVPEAGGLCHRASRGRPRHALYSLLFRLFVKPFLLSLTGSPIGQGLAEDVVPALAICLPRTLS